MEPVMVPVGVRDAKNRFSELTLAVNETGKPLIVLKNNKPWVTIQPADSALARRRERLGGSGNSRGKLNQRLWRSPYGTNRFLTESCSTKSG